MKSMHSVLNVNRQVQLFQYHQSMHNTICLGHAVCMEMSDEMWKTVQQYQWMCMDCKPCSFCSKLDEEVIAFGFYIYL